MSNSALTALGRFASKFPRNITCSIPRRHGSAAFQIRSVTMRALWTSFPDDLFHLSPSRVSTIAMADWDGLDDISYATLVTADPNDGYVYPRVQSTGRKQPF